jgi:hypothetical protein
MTESAESFVCSVCGQVHGGLSTDTAFTLPDVVWAIPEPERQQQAKWTSDLCQMGEQYFIRCLLPVSFTDQPGYYGWGVWAEVEWPVFKRYLDLYDADGSDEPLALGQISNEVAAYGGTIGLPVCIQFGPSSQRPVLSFLEGEEHGFAREAASGMSSSRFHEILAGRAHT